MAGELRVTRADELRDQRLVTGVRFGLLILVVTLSTLNRAADRHPVALTLLILLAVAATLPVRSPVMVRWRPVAEAVLAAAVIATTNPFDPVLLPYLIAPAMAAGFAAGAAGAVLASGLAAAVLVVDLFLGPDGANAEHTTALAEWVFIALVSGLLAAWVRRIQAAGSSQNASYAEAYRLLTQLREVSRQLAGGLDPVSIGQALLESLMPAVPYDGAALYTRTPGARFGLLAREGVPVEWDADADDSSPWSRAVATRAPQPGGQPREPALVLPLLVQGRVTGVVGVARTHPPVSAGEVEAARRVAADAAMRLDTALLFDEVRTVATAEERRRLAREIHDGIAQELTSFGYQIDDLAARGSDEPALAAALADLRSDVSRLITELRLSIFDLRSEVGPAAGLSAALADYARAVGAASGLIVHLELAEAPTRLRVATESELLRIAQEAITNARKHASARNLWVTLRIEPPGALLRVEDDGRGLGPGRTDSFGMEIRGERAARLGATLAVDQRPEGGTLVEVVLGHPKRAEDDPQHAAKGERPRAHDRAAR